MSEFPTICIMGPTASGKTQLAVDIAERLSVEIISVDSALVYKGMDIGTAKPEAEILKRVPHHLIDICDPSEAYSVGKFVQDAIRLIDEIKSRNAIPFLVGGTMLYFWALQKGISELPQSDLVLRESLDLEAKEIGWAALHQRLESVDPVSANRINPNDSQRIQRALELYLNTGKTLTEHLQAQGNSNIDCQFVNVVLMPPDRASLHQKIALRFDQMLEKGFLNEVQCLYGRGNLNASMPSIRTVGYRQAWQYLEGEMDYESMREKSIIATRQLAKRQFTWLKRWPEEDHYNSEDSDLLNKVLSSIPKSS